ncbi:MAG: hypothetical protein Q8L48_31240 [Archangium sp.]|nr:hypothetical protein [Archangium sp.]
MSDPSPGRSRGHCLDDNELFDLAGGRLKETDLVLFEAHLDRCPACRRVVAAVARREARSSSAAGELAIQPLDVNGPDEPRLR